MTYLKDADFSFGNILLTPETTRLWEWISVIPDDGTEYEKGWMHDRYMNVGVVVGGVGGAVATGDDSATSAETKARAFMNRKVFSADNTCIVNANLAQFNLWSDIGSPVSWVMHREIGVLNRIVDSSTLLDDDSVDQRYRGLTCYFFRVRVEAPNNLRFTLGRYQLGS
jgi:hypothetical protein